MHFFDQLRAEHPRDERLAEHLGVNYDTCHFAVEFEEPQNALACLVHHGIKISKIQLSSALKVSPTPAAREALHHFADDVYLHQVVARDAGRQPDDFSRSARRLGPRPLGLGTGKTVELPEWRIHFHVPLHAPAAPPFDNTNDHLLGVLDLLLASSPQDLCPPGNGNLHLGGAAAGIEKRTA
jgi:hypothetical protein